MIWVLVLLGSDVLVLAVGLLLQRHYLRHLRHHHRPQWEVMRHRAPRSWRYFRGMPTTGFLIASIFNDPAYRKEAERGHRALGRWVMIFNLLHPLLLTAVVVVSLYHFLS